MPFVSAYQGLTEGPLGFPLPDETARSLEVVLKKLPRTAEHAYRQVPLNAESELLPGERADLSWISTERVDRLGEVVKADGMDDSQFRLNPLVTLGHRYDLPPVGRSVWRRRRRQGDLVGVQAKTIYPERPITWPSDQPWTPDQVFALVQANLLQGKSIGFLPTRVHAPDSDECQRHGWRDCRLVIDEWLLLEYACVTLPANQEALVQAVAKGVLQLPTELHRCLQLTSALPRSLSFTPWTEVESAVRRRLVECNLERLVQDVVQRMLERLRGRV